MPGHAKRDFTRNFDAVYSGLLVNSGSVPRICVQHATWAFIMFHCF